MVHVHPIPAFRDNYIWLLVGAGAPASVVLIDPGDAAPVIETLDRLRLRPTAVFITHHHDDHIGGLGELGDRYAPEVYGPADERIPHLTRTVGSGDRVALPGLPGFRVFDVPGHTKVHIAYAAEDLLFCGDTLFAGGCGRIRGGTAAQLYTSLNVLATLSDDTLVYCAHEYTLSNLGFALAVEPHNPRLQTRYRDAQAMRQRGEATVPSLMRLEKETNPFLRCHVPAVVAAASRHAGRPVQPGLETFATLRGWKDGWNS